MVRMTSLCCKRLALASRWAMPCQSCARMPSARRSAMPRMVSPMRWSGWASPEVTAAPVSMSRELPPGALMVAGFTCGQPIAPHQRAIVAEPPQHARGDGPLQIAAISSLGAEWDARQQLHALLDGVDAIDVELAIAHRLDHLIAQHERADIHARDNDPLLTGQSTLLADAEISLDLVGDTPHSLRLATLVDRPSDSERLLDWYIR